MMRIDGFRQIEKLLEKPLQIGCVEQILAARHVRHALARVIDDDG